MSESPGVGVWGRDAGWGLLRRPRLCARQPGPCPAGPTRSLVAGVASAGWWPWTLNLPGGPCHRLQGPPRRQAHLPAVTPFLLQGQGHRRSTTGLLTAATTWGGGGGWGGTASPEPTPHPSNRKRPRAEPMGVTKGSLGDALHTHTWSLPQGPSKRETPPRL